MEPILTQKQSFYAVYDYGMGGIWFIVLARTKDEVTKKYPFLQVVEDNCFPPGFKLSEINSEFIQDIDKPDIDMIEAAKTEYGTHEPSATS